MAMGPDILPALDAMSSQYRGFAGLGLGDLGDPEVAAFAEPYIYHFPDGNASIARLLVRSLIRRVAPGHTMDDVLLANFDYAKLDVDGAPTRLRLNSTVVGLANARERGWSGGHRLCAGGRLRRVRAQQCVLGLLQHDHSAHHARAARRPKAGARAQSVKMPLVYVNVAVRNWQRVREIGRR